MFENFRFTQPFTTDNFKKIGGKVWDGASYVGGGLKSGWDSFTSNPTTDVTAGSVLNQMQGLGYEDAYKVADSNGVFKNGNNVLKMNDDGSYSIYNSNTGKAYGMDTVLGTKGGEFNMGKTLGNVNNLVKAGLGGWSLYQNISMFKDRKDLLAAEKDTAEEKLKWLQENRADLQAERARRDRIRSTSVKQRAGTSSVSSW